MKSLSFHFLPNCIVLLFFFFLLHVFTLDLSALHCTTSLFASIGIRNAVDSILSNSFSSGETACVAVHLSHPEVRDLNLNTEDRNLVFLSERQQLKIEGPVSIPLDSVRTK